MRDKSSLVVKWGIILIIYGFFKDTTVENSFGRIHNIGLMQQSQKIMLIGGIALIGGLIWKASKQHQDPNQSTTSAKERFDKPPVIGESFSEERKGPKEKKQRGVIKRLNDFRDKFFLRVLIGPFTGLLAFGLTLIAIGLVTLTIKSKELPASILQPMLSTYCILFTLVLLGRLPFVFISRMVFGYCAIVSIALSTCVIAILIRDILSSQGVNDHILTISVFCMLELLMLVPGYFTFRYLSKRLV